MQLSIYSILSNKKLQKLFPILFFLFEVTTVYCQLLTGTIEDTKGNSIVAATVLIKETGNGAVSDLNGVFRFNNIPVGQYQLTVSALGFIEKNIAVSINQNQQKLNVVLEDDIKVLDEVLILGKSSATIIREQAYAVEVVESKGFKNLSTNANDILGRVSGVNIRRSGGVGSDFTLSLNGLSGNQVRIFLDGVPMDYFGSSLSLNNFSANIIDRIEVYKGVVPIHISSDALGGAINVTTGGKSSSYLDASYSLGSFNTHLASINAQYRDQKSGFTTRFKSFLNYSDNNYKVPVKLINFDTGKEDQEPTLVERFHDAYQSKMGWAEIGFTGTRFADQLMAGVIYSDNHNEIQQPPNAIGQAKIPYGKVATEEEKIITNFAFNKKGIFSDKLSFNSYLVAVFSESLSRDTASVRYDWFGNPYPKIDNTTGEIEGRKTLLTLSSENVLANANAEYSINESTSITTNYSLNHLSLRGTDPFKAQNNTQFNQPNLVSKQ
ncbi:MAG: carboxypeptidase-like regulatory domain-containing protein, partial [Saprospiraceae bacterium]|nr:carboxypeptidase-like regulatory domain-containing protein [Saprospiraceae bacterium]